MIAEPILVVAALAAAALVLAHLIRQAHMFVAGWSARLAIAALIAPVMPVAAWLFGIQLPAWMPPAGVAICAFVGYRRFIRSGSRVSRWGETSRRKAGVASVMDVWRAASWWRLRRKARQLRPALCADMTRRELLRVPLSEFGIVICRAGLLQVRSACEDVTMLFGPPRSGKTGGLGCYVIDAPGACLVTSTRTDLYVITAAERRRRGPVYVFNPAGVGGTPYASTVTFDPLIGCSDPVTAQERAADLLAINGGADGDSDSERGWWNGQGIRVLAALLHAAALGGRSMETVAAWVADPKQYDRDILGLLRRNHSGGYATTVEQFIGTNDRTRTSITTTIQPALAWLVSASALASATPGNGSLDVAELLDARGTVYLIGTPDSFTGPLVSALTGYITREARRIAAHGKGGRLDPQLTLALDEAALLGPPLEKWTADMGGRNVHIIAAFQSRMQMLARWTETQAGEILNNCGTLVLFGGTNDAADLEWWSTRAGTRDEPQLTKDKNGRVVTRTVRKTPVLAPAQLANLPAGVAVVFRRGMPPVVGRVRMVWQRPELRRRWRDRLTLAWRDLWYRSATVAPTAPAPAAPPPLRAVPDREDAAA